MTEHKTDVIFLGQVLTSQRVIEVAAGQMDFTTHADFSDFPVRMCMQMTNSPVYYRYVSVSSIVEVSTKFDGSCISV